LEAMQEALGAQGWKPKGDARSAAEKALG